MTTQNVVYKLHVGSWYTYTGYWSSLEVAAEKLPRDKDFIKAVRLLLPDYAKEHANSNLQKLRIEPIDKYRCTIWAVNAYCVYREYEDVKEVREPGVPYVPASRRLISERTEYKDVYLGELYVTEIKLDEVST